MNNVLKLLDRGVTIVLFKNMLGSYTAVGLPMDDERQAVVTELVDQLIEDEPLSRQVTEDFSPSDALDRLTEKLLATGDYRGWPDNLPEAS